MTVGASYNYGWNMVNYIPDAGKSKAHEFNYYVEYEVKQGIAEGLALGVYAGHLRFKDNEFYGIEDRNDIKVILSYSKTFGEVFKRK